MNIIRTSKVAAALRPSLVRGIFDKARQYDDVIDFTLGDPDIHPHQDIKDAGCQAIQLGKTRYSQNVGIPELRKAIARHYKLTTGVAFDPDSEIIVTVGAMEGLFLALFAILDAGDEVIIPAPYYSNYAEMVKLCKATPIIINSTSKENFDIDLKSMEFAVTSRTKALIINSPSNPSGLILSPEKLRDLGSLARRYGLTVISDEVYRGMTFGGGRAMSISEVYGMKKRSILVNSLSKEFCMTGWRIGYVLAPANVISALTILQENIVACAPVPSQYAAVKALSGGDAYNRDMVAVYEHRRDLLVEGINSIEGVKCIKPDATFYALVDISATGMKSVEFAESLLKEEHVAVVPGIAYGERFDSYVRMAFTVDDAAIRSGVRRIRNYLVTHHGVR